MLFLARFNCYAQITKQDSSVITPQDTSSLTVDSLNSDSISVKSVKLKESNDIATTVKYFAKDSIMLDAQNKMAYLYGEAFVDYGNIHLEAAYIEIDYTTNEVKAYGVPDTTGKIIGKPIFKDNEDVFTSDTMRYNFKTGKGIIHNAVTQEGEGYIHIEKAAINKEGELYVNQAKYTTCNLEHPHFAIRSKRLKLVPDKVVVSGPFHLEIGDIPTPLGFIFGIFPIPKKRSSGVVIPTYGESGQRGFFLKDGGYYWAMNDHIGMKFVGDGYSNGSWRFNIETQYRKRYSYKGNLVLSLTKIIDGFDGDTTVYDGFLDGKSYWVKWTHNPEQKGNSRFSASVNLGSSNYQKNNSFNVQTFLSANFNSNINYYKKFGTSPFSLNASMRQDQSQDGTMNFTLPDLSFNMQRRFPFKYTKGKSSSWHKQLSIQYSLLSKNRISNVTNPYSSSLNVVNDVEEKTFTDLNFLNPPSMKANSNFGIKHVIPIQTSIKALKYFNINPSLKYEETWYTSKLGYNGYAPVSTTINGVDTTVHGVVIDTINGFQRLSSFNTNISATTRIYGNFKYKGKNVVRHTMVPTLSYSYRPDFGDEKYGYYETVKVDTAGEYNEFQKLSLFNNYIMGVPSSGEQQTLTLKLDNIFEMRVKNKRDTVKRFKIIKLFDNFSARTAYNFAAESLQVQPLTVSARTRIAGFTISYNSSHDFYKYGYLDDDYQVKGRTNTLLIADNLGLVRTTAAKLALSTNFNPKGRKQKEVETKNEQEKQMLQQINANPDMYVDFNIPWSLNVNYNLQWLRNGFQSDTATITQAFNFSGDISLTPKWKIGFNSGYDIQRKAFTPTKISVFRDLHCWEMRFNWIPFGTWQSYSFDINVKSSILQDLKMSKRDDWRNN